MLGAVLAGVCCLWAGPEGLGAEEDPAGADAKQAAEFLRACDRAWLARFPRRLRVVDRRTMSRQHLPAVNRRSTVRSEATVWDGRFLRRVLTIPEGGAQGRAASEPENVLESVLTFDGLRWTHVVRNRGGTLDWRAVRGDENPDLALNLWLFMASRSAFGYDSLSNVLSRATPVGVARPEPGRLVLDVAPTQGVAHALLDGEPIGGHVGWRFECDGAHDWRPTRITWVYASNADLGLPVDAALEALTFGGRPCVVAQVDEWSQWQRLGEISVPCRRYIRTIEPDDVFETEVEGAMCAIGEPPDWLGMSVPLPNDYGPLGEITDLSRSGRVIVDLRGMSNTVERRTERCERALACARHGDPRHRGPGVALESWSTWAAMVLGAVFGFTLIAIVRPFPTAAGPGRSFDTGRTED